MLQGVFSGKDDKRIKTALSLSCNFQWVGECSWQADEGERPQGQEGERKRDRRAKRMREGDKKIVKESKRTSRI